MSLIKDNLNMLWATLIVEELIRLGCQNFFLSPGSRCTPLTVAVARHEKARILKSYDERSLGFCALGTAKATKRPSVIVVTSGTAAANLFPAIVEASADYVPLIILTADRPFELRNIGANQTIDQVKIFGSFVRDFFDLPVPTDAILARNLLSTIDQTVFKSLGANPGPVHVNCMFREPLDPDCKQEYSLKCLSGLDSWLTEQTPLTKHLFRPLNITEADCAHLADLVKHSERGLIVVGGLTNQDDLLSILKLAEHLNWPVFADVTSSLRFYQHDSVVHYVDQLLLEERYKNKQFDVVLQFGGRLTSKRLMLFLQQLNPGAFVYFDEYGERRSPDCLATMRVHASVASVCQKLLSLLNPAKQMPAHYCKSGSEQIAKFFANEFGEEQTLSEPYVARYISEASDWSAQTLFLSSSMPIRDMEMYAKPAKTMPQVAANRGASGIDGIISSAIGFAYGTNKNLTLLVGDLAFLHDGNGLAFLSQVKIPVTIVVINNQGGGIFSFLPIAKSSDVFDEFFTTEHEHELSGLTTAFGVEHVKVETVAAFQKAYLHSSKGSKHCVIEVLSSAKANYEFHMNMNLKVLQNLKESDNV